ncbi:MAG TPA: hypothetical protein VD927_12360 [Chryseosolibacter sp.]|nr:hypothetical protein [Chryseosolibacter sp.]
MTYELIYFSTSKINNMRKLKWVIILAVIVILGATAFSVLDPDPPCTPGSSTWPGCLGGGK